MKKVSLFLDSGAFSAMSKGVEIKIKEYIEFIKTHKDFIDVYANLDVIDDPEATMKNQAIMEKAGLKPLPCFHYGEDIKYLKHYLSKYEYLGLGGMVPISTKDLTVWLDNLFSNHICGPDGMPKVKIHGFGMTSFDLMLRYPWFSVDSTSWVMTGRYGSVFVPRFKDGKYIYTEPPFKVVVSNQSPDQKDQGKHINTFSAMERKVIEKYFNSKGYVLGKSIYRNESAKYRLADGERWAGKEEADAQRNIHGTKDGYVIKGHSKDYIVEQVVEAGVCNDYKMRDELNIIYYLDLEKNLPKWPWPFKKTQQASVRGFGLK